MKLLQIENRHGKLSLNDGVHKDSADKLIQELDQLFGNSAVLAQMSIGDVVCAADDALEGVEVEINSPGGSVFEGHRIYNSLRAMSDRGVPVITTVNGLAASMGSVILMAGDTRQITKGSRIMIHEASTMAQGDSKSLRKTADMLEGISAEIAGVYAERTGGDQEAIRDLMHAETWMDAAQAKENGFVQSIVGEKEDDASASIDTQPKVMKKSFLSSIFPGNADVEKFEAELAENETLRADLTDAQAKITELSGHAEVIAEKDVELKASQGAIVEHLAKISEVESSLTEATAKLETFDSEVEAGVLAKFEGLGGQPIPASDKHDENTEAKPDAYAEYRNLQKTDPRAAADYWTANEDQIKSI
tara:strand:+ start:4452 stop:5537 length:1086 start_codon:yes stop_codon:yes gene_type:complete